MPRRFSPIIALAVVAAVPAVALAGLWSYADSRRVTTAADAVAPHAAVALNTPLLSLRRLPATLARASADTALRTALQPVLAAIDDSSCLSVAVDGRAVAAQNITTTLRPASNLKLFTAAVALDVLGAQFRFDTSARGSLTDGVVHGDLFMVGGGDPVLSSSWWHGPSAAHPQVNSTSLRGSRSPPDQRRRDR